MAAKSNSQAGRLVIWGIVALAAVVVLVVRASRTEPNLEQAMKDPAVGKELPPLELKPLTGEADEVSLDTLRGKVVVINYWGTWCPPCVKEFPRLAEVWDRNRGKADFKFISVSTKDSPENVDSLREDTDKFLKSHGVAMPIYVDPLGVSRDKLGDLINEISPEYPITVIADRQGVVRAVWRGYADGDERAVEQMISTLLAESQ